MDRTWCSASTTTSSRLQPDRSPIVWVTHWSPPRCNTFPKVTTIAPALVTSRASSRCRRRAMIVCSTQPCGRSGRMGSPTFCSSVTAAAIKRGSPPWPTRSTWNGQARVFASTRWSTTTKRVVLPFATTCRKRSAGMPRRWARTRGPATRHNYSTCLATVFGATSYCRMAVVLTPA